MKRNTSLWLAGAAVVVVAGVAGYSMQPQQQQQPAPAKRQAAVDFSVPLTPAGIILTAQGNPMGKDGLAHVGGVNRYAATPTIYADAKGMTLYTYDKDTEAGKSSCTAECLQAWPAAVAPADAKPAGDWSVIAREDGSKQWALKGKPLYRFAKDEVPGDAKGNGLADNTWHSAVFKQGVARVAYATEIFKPTLGVTFPYGISVQENSDAGGQVMIDEIGHAIYAFDGDPKQDKPVCAANTSCSASPWTPVAAPALAGNVGDFTVVKRADGTGQWAYKGVALYTFKGDQMADQANGIGVDPRWKPAVMVRYPTPAPVTVQTTLANGKVLATADGRSLYRQHMYYYNVEGHDFKHGHLYQPLLGRLLGTRGCEGDCTQSWQPFVAAADAQPSGYWSIYNRPDGVRQWAYKGYALYTYSADKKPGQLLGLNTWSLSINDPALHTVSFLSTLKIDAEIMSGVVWTTAYP